jgi:hypothetical protein
MVFEHQLRHRAPLVATTLFFAIACLVLSGCGNKLSQVSGVITLDGQPLKGGHGDTRVTVSFQPMNGMGMTAIGLADENGVYHLSTGSQSGVPPGEYAVSCAVSQLVPAKNPKEPAGGRRITDAKYADPKTSGLRFNVQPGKNKFDIALISPPKSPAGQGL